MRDIVLDVVREKIRINAEKVDRNMLEDAKIMLYDTINDKDKREW